jgi:hypothetical protein
MKKYILLFIVTLVSGLSATAQQAPMGASGSGSPGRAGEFSCPGNSIFSQIPYSTPYTWFGDDTYSYTRIADDFTVTDPIGAMRFWGVNYFTCPTGSSVDFIIKFYQRNLVDPTIPGNEVASFNVTAVPQPVNIAEWPSSYPYQIDVTFPGGVTLTDGWISITRTNATDGCTFGWMGTLPETGNSASYNGTWVVSGGILAFCLSPSPIIPVSNWAIFAGLLLIGTFIVIRYRRII